MTLAKTSRRLHKKLNKFGLSTEEKTCYIFIEREVKEFVFFLHRVEFPSPLLLVFAISGLEWLSTPAHPPLRSSIPLNRFFVFSIVDGRAMAKKMTLFNGSAQIKSCSFENGEFIML